MNRALLFAPFVGAVVLAVAVRFLRNSPAGDVAFALILVSTAACLACVPVISRKNFFLGYLALLFPFGLLAAALHLGSVHWYWA